MLRISGPKITEIAKELDGIEIQGINFNQKEEPKGIQVLFLTNADDEETAKSVVKSFLKEKFPVLRIYVEVI